MNDAQCQGIGHGTLTDRQGARKLVAQRQHEVRDRMQRAVHEASAAIGPRPAERYAPNAEMEALRGEIAELRQSIADLGGLIAKISTTARKAKAAYTRQQRG